MYFRRGAKLGQLENRQLQPFTSYDLTNLSQWGNQTMGLAAMRERDGGEPITRRIMVTLPAKWILFLMMTLLEKD